MRRWVRQRAALVLVGFALAAAAGAVAGATIPDSAGVIHACLNTSSSGASPNVRIIDSEASQSCTGGEQALEWSQQGPQGSAGPQGPAGAPGRPRTVLYYTHEKPIRLPLKRGTPVARFEIPEGDWLVSMSGQVESSSERGLLGIAFDPSALECSMEVRGATGNLIAGNFIGTEHYGPVPGRERVTVKSFANIVRTLRVTVPAGGRTGVLSCGYLNDGKLSGGGRARPAKLGDVLIKIDDLSGETASAGEELEVLPAGARSR